VSLELRPNIEDIKEARRQVIEWIGPNGGPMPTFGALSDLLAAARRLLAVEESAVLVKWCNVHGWLVRFCGVTSAGLPTENDLAGVAPCDISDAVIYPGETK
jgi:hypothetical protein